MPIRKTRIRLRVATREILPPTQGIVHRLDTEEEVLEFGAHRPRPCAPTSVLPFTSTTDPKTWWRRKAGRRTLRIVIQASRPHLNRPTPPLLGCTRRDRTVSRTYTPPHLRVCHRILQFAFDRAVELVDFPTRRQSVTVRRLSQPPQRLRPSRLRVPFLCPIAEAKGGVQISRATATSPPLPR